MSFAVAGMETFILDSPRIWSVVWKSIPKERRYQLAADVHFSSFIVSIIVPRLMRFGDSVTSKRPKGNEPLN
jgi:hypothetical protein